MDLTYNIRKLISPIANEHEYATRDLEVRALDDLDERYVIKMKDGDGMWLNFVKAPLWIERVCSPEKGIIEVTVQKEYPKYQGCGDVEKFQKEVTDYFNVLFGGSSIFGTCFRMREKPFFDKVDTSYMSYNEEGDEMGMVERESDAYIGSTFILDGPTHCDEECYTSAISEDMKDFILRKLEAIFNKKGAYCREIPCKNPDSLHEGLLHYEFIISDF